MLYNFISESCVSLFWAQYTNSRSQKMCLKILSNNILTIELFNNNHNNNVITFRRKIFFTPNFSGDFLDNIYVPRSGEGVGHILGERPSDVLCE